MRRQVKIEHLRHHLENLTSHPDLREAMRTVVAVDEPIQIDDQATFKLKSMGLIRKQGDRVEPLGDLYRFYFRSRLGVNQG
ncbi:MAG TPA: AAA-like domain-containing protein [Leptolyngbyaceae cyanobacterium M65_K2018_010]|nr:AAA-like domain-containing protein [Leptolyngbyaceae cyanobacterium M65_K2018_010]